MNDKDIYQLKDMISTSRDDYIDDLLEELSTTFNYADVSDVDAIAKWHSQVNVAIDEFKEKLNDLEYRTASSLFAKRLENKFPNEFSILNAVWKCTDIKANEAQYFLDNKYRSFVVHITHDGEYYIAKIKSKNIEISGDPHKSYRKAIDSLELMATSGIRVM